MLEELGGYIIFGWMKDEGTTIFVGGIRRVQLFLLEELGRYIIFGWRKEEGTAIFC